VKAKVPKVSALSLGYGGTALLKLGVVER